MEKPQIRKARPDDADAFYELLIMSSPHFETIFGGMCPDLLKHMFRLRRNSFSHEHTLFIDCEGEPAAMLLSYDWKTRARETAGTAMIFIARAGLSLLPVIPSLLKVSRVSGTVYKGEYYISNIAVYEKFRGRGLAGALLAEAESRARKAGAHSLALEAEEDNTPAIGMYEKLGFAATSRGEVSLHGQHMAVVRMVRKL